MTWWRWQYGQMFFGLIATTEEVTCLFGPQHMDILSFPNLQYDIWELVSVNDSDKPGCACSTASDAALVLLVPVFELWYAHSCRINAHSIEIRSGWEKSVHYMLSRMLHWKMKRPKQAWKWTSTAELWIIWRDMFHRTANVAWIDQLLVVMARKKWLGKPNSSASLEDICV